MKSKKLKCKNQLKRWIIDGIHQQAFANFVRDRLRDVHFALHRVGELQHANSIELYAFGSELICAL
jgi:hypothetical protein